MAQQNRTYLKSKFESGDKPSEQDFIDIIDSALNYADDGIVSKNLPFSYFQFDADTVDVNQGLGEFWFNDSDMSLATFLYVSTFEFGGMSVIDRIPTLNTGATIRVANRANNGIGAMLKVGGAIVLDTGSNYFKIPIAVSSWQGAFGAGNICGFDFVNAETISTTITAPTIAATVLDVDFLSKNNYETSSEVLATANFSVTISNSTNARNAQIDLHITNSIIITLPANSLMQDDEDRWTASPTYQIAVDGLTGNSYELSFRKIGTKLKWILSQKFE